MEKRAVGKYLKGSPKKARLVVDLIKDKNVYDALYILKNCKKRAAREVEKVLKSAMANVEHESTDKVDFNDYYVSKAYVDMGPTKWRRRLRPAPMGRAYFERRHYCHITVYISEYE